MLPVGGMLTRGFFPDGQLDLSAVPEVLSRRRTLRVLTFTLVSASAGTVLTLLAGLPVAFVLYRLRFPGRAVLRAVIVMPFVLPTVVVGVAFRALLAADGPLGFLGLDRTFTDLVQGQDALGWGVDQSVAQVRHQHPIAASGEIFRIRPELFPRGRQPVAQHHRHPVPRPQIVIDEADGVSAEELRHDKAPSPDAARRPLPQRER